MTKQEAFADLQRKDPQQGAWLIAMAAAFGKPPAITIRFAHDAFSLGTFEKQAVQEAPQLKRMKKK